MKAPWKSIEAIFIIASVLLSAVGAQVHPVFANPAPFLPGDVFAGIGDGLVQHFDPDGILLETLNTEKGGGIFTTGCAFDSAGNLYVTTFNGHDVTRFRGPNDPHINLGTFGSGYSGNPESIVFDAIGNVYVGAINGDNDIRKFDAEGNPVARFDVEIERVGTDWIELAADQRTMFYTSEGKRILRYDVADRVQLPDFTSSLPGTHAFALRILPDGSVLVANREFVLHLDASGKEIQRYDVPGEDTWFSLNLDPDGTSFWAGNFGTGRFYKFDIAAGGDPLLTVDTGAGAGKLYGICVFGEETTALEDTDGDALLDLWEENGFDFDGDGNPDVDLPGMGADKNHKDIFVYVDWLENSGFLGHDHRPDDDAIKKVKAAFANAPVDNPDGEPGINLHVVFGQAIEETDQNKELGTVDGEWDYTWSEFAILKEDHFPPENWPIFHYAIFGHDLPKFPGLDNQRPGGFSRNRDGDFDAGASDFIVALGFWENFLFGIGLEGGVTNARAGTLMHELGHNLGLGHGGVILDADGNLVNAQHTNYKPNHLSVMNYSFQSRGLRKKDSQGSFSNGHFDYSRFGPDVLPGLDETDLSEPDGLNGSDAVKDYGTRYYCQGTGISITVNGLQEAVNWNCDLDKTDTALMTNINKDKDDDENPILTTLTTVNEWPHLRYKGGAIGVFGIGPELPETTSMQISPELTFEEDRAIGPFEEVVEVVEVVIDIKPSSDPNSINLKSKGVIPVSILTMEDFDATTVDPLSAKFGPDGAPESHGRGHIEDVDGDGDLDLMLHFRTEESGIRCSDNSASLSAETFEGQLVEGVDSIKTLGCKK